MKPLNEITRLQQIAGIKSKSLLTENTESNYEKVKSIFISYEDEDILRDFENTFPEGQNISKEDYWKFSEKYIDDMSELDLIDDNWNDLVGEEDLDEIGKLNEDDKKDEVLEFLLGTYDGPVTISTIISRAIEVAWEHQAPQDDIAEAVYEAMDTLGEEGGRIDSSEY